MGTIKGADAATKSCSPAGSREPNLWIVERAGISSTRRFDGVAQSSITARTTRLLRCQPFEYARKTRIFGVFAATRRAGADLRSRHGRRYSQSVDGDAQLHGATA